MYYDTPVDQPVLGFQVKSEDSLTASVTAGSPYFEVSKIAAYEQVHTIILATGLGEAPVHLGDLSPSPIHQPILRPTSKLIATSNGVTPLVVFPGQQVGLWVRAYVPKGALPPGKFTGTVLLKGKSSTKTVTLEGTYLGTLMGKVVVQPETVVPGQHVLVQVWDASGKPLSDPTVTVTMQGISGTTRYYQFPTVGSRNLVVRAVRGSLSETTQTTVAVARGPLTFRPSLAPPTVTTGATTLGLKLNITINSFQQRS
jgi:hypothetical protein